MEERRFQIQTIEKRRRVENEILEWGIVMWLKGNAAAKLTLQTEHTAEEEAPHITSQQATIPEETAPVSPK